MLLTPLVGFKGSSARLAVALTSAHEMNRGRGPDGGPPSSLAKGGAVGIRHVGKVSRRQLLRTE